MQTLLELPNTGMLQFGLSLQRKRGGGRKDTKEIEKETYIGSRQKMPKTGHSY